MTELLPPWRIHGEDGSMLIIEVDLPDFSHAYLTTSQAQLDGPEFNAMVRSLVEHWRRGQTDIRTGG